MSYFNSSFSFVPINENSIVLFFILYVCIYVFLLFYFFWLSCSPQTINCLITNNNYSIRHVIYFSATASFNRHTHTHNLNNDRPKRIIIREKALVMYVLTTNAQIQETFHKYTTTGSMCFNDTVLQYIGKHFHFTSLLCRFLLIPKTKKIRFFDHNFRPILIWMFKIRTYAHALLRLLDSFAQNIFPLYPQM